MKELVPLFVAGLITLALASHASAEAKGATAEVLTGLDVLKRDNFAPLKGKNIAIVTNHTARDRQGNHIIDLLRKAEGVKIVALFSPEHGLYGTLDEKVGHGVDEKTGLKVWSLYGQTRRPTAEMLKGVDTIVFDIQDVGARFYTYSATMGICMEEAAKHKLAMFVLDRPNPITGENVDGPIADEDQLGFTAFRRIPVAHGMTFGELAQLFNTEYGGINADLHVVKMENWKRDMWWDETGLTWVNPSPNMRNLTQATLYPGVCLVEATNLSVGRGTDQPFELIGAPWIDGQKLSAAMNAANLPGLRTYPIEFTPAKGSKLGTQKCQGIFFLVTDRNTLEPVRSGVTLAHHLYKIHGDKFEVDKVVRLLQNKEIAEALKTTDPAQVAEMWKDDVEQFKKLREKHLIYR
ncbi:MAG TPA: DUF1343 domain-containing protein [Tepidisphaeraceae bacterium]|nr:DUF1343 domain-containing protein [Tepidisphaeraceae bacterium]